MKFANIYKISYMCIGIIFVINLMLENIITLMTAEITPLQF